MIILRILSLVVIGTIPILFGAIQPWIWALYALLALSAFIIFLFNIQDHSFLHYISHFNKNLILFFIWSLLLCITLPQSLVSLLSPTRFEILSESRALIGSSPTWETISYLSKNALSWWVFLLSLGLFYIVLQNLCKDRRMLKRIVFVMIGIGILEAIYGLIQALVPSMGVLWVDYVHDYMGNARGTFINRNHFAGFVEMVWPLILAYAISITYRGRSSKMALAYDFLNRQALMALCIVVLILALLLSRSRAGIIGCFIGFITFWFMTRPTIKKITYHTRLLFVGIVIILSVYCLSIGVGHIFERFLSIDDSYSRIEIWRNSLFIIKDHPFGVGLRNYESVFKVYNQSFAQNKAVLYAHNDYLQLLVETGWIGFFSIISGFVLFLVRSVRRINRLDFRSDPLRFYLSVGAFSGIVSLAFHSFFDFNLQIPANCLYFVTLIAIVSSCTEQVKLKQHTENTH